MTAQIFDLEAERAKRGARIPKPPPQLLRNGGFPSAATPTRLLTAITLWCSSAPAPGCLIELIGTEREWNSERRYQTEDAARSDALLAVRQLGRSPRHA